MLSRRSRLSPPSLVRCSCKHLFYSFSLFSFHFLFLYDRQPPPFIHYLKVKNICHTLPSPFQHVFEWYTFQTRFVLFVRHGCCLESIRGNNKRMWLIHMVPVSRDIDPLFSFHHGDRSSSSSHSCPLSTAHHLPFLLPIFPPLRSSSSLFIDFFSPTFPFSFARSPPLLKQKNDSRYLCLYR